MSSEITENLINFNQQKIHFIRAGAGAGKTTTLIQTCIDFVRDFKKQHQRFPRIILTTFTNKATQEIKERLILKAIELNDEDLFQYFNKKSFVQIGTIHSVLNLYLRQYCELLEFPVVLTIKDQSYFYKKIRKVIKNNLEKNSNYQNLLDQLSFNDLIRLSLKYKEHYLSYEHLKPISVDEIKKISEQKKKSYLSAIEDFINLFQDDFPQAWGDSVSYLKQIRIQLPKMQSYSDWEQLFELKPSRKFTWKKTHELYHEEINEQLSNLFSIDCLSDLDFATGQSAYAQFQEKIGLFLNEIVQELISYQKQSGEISISDLEGFSLQLLKNFPESMKEFSEQFDFFMIDEYQDTSPLQVHLLNHLTEGKPHFIVGDPQQSIYLFRGARSEVFSEKENEVKKLGYKITEKITNYRSHPRLMSFINDFFAEFSSAFKSMNPKHNNYEKQKISEAFFISTDDEKLAILKHIDFLVRHGVDLSDISILFKKNSEIIEFQKLAQRVQLPVQMLIAKGFDDKLEITDLIIFLKFLVNPFDNMNLLALLRMPYWQVSDQDLLNYRNAFFEREADTIQSLWLQIKKYNTELFKELDEFQNIYKLSGVMASLIQFIHVKSFLSTSLIYDSSTMRESNIWKFVQALHEAQQKSDFLLADFINQSGSGLSEDLVSTGGEGIPLIKLNRVNLMTIHGSKGLQFKHVIIPGMNTEVRREVTRQKSIQFSEELEKFVVDYKFDDDDKNVAFAWVKDLQNAKYDRILAESERLLYVAMTRAEASIALIGNSTLQSKAKNSWLAKMNWSEQKYQNSQYTVEFINFHSEDNNQTLDQAESQDYSFTQIFEHEFVDDETHQPLKIQLAKKQSKGVTTLLDEDQKVIDQSQEVAQTNNPELKNKVNLENLISMTEKAKRGTDLHQLFEALKYNDLSELQEGLTSEELTMLNWLVQNQDVPLKEILNEGYVEWGFGLKIQDMMIQGQIDAWGIFNNELYVIDYKTGRIEYKDKAIKQLKFYTQCLYQMKKITNINKINLVVIYPHLGTTVIEEVMPSDLHALELV